MSREEMLKRALNVGFSGGEKKRLEILQMALFEPKLAILDETDSGLDIDALKLVAEGVNALRAPERAMLVITHYQRLLDYIVPDRIHVLAEGRIVAEGGKELALELEAKGYEHIVKAGGMSGRPSSLGIAEARARRSARRCCRAVACRIAASRNGNIPISSRRWAKQASARSRPSGRSAICPTASSCSISPTGQSRRTGCRRISARPTQQCDERGVAGAVARAASRLRVPKGAQIADAADAGFHRRRSCRVRCWCWKRARR